MAIFKRIPKRGEIASVYGVIVLIVYGWTIIAFLWELPSWRDFLTISEIFNVFAYSIVVNFLESLVVLSLPILLSIILPRKWFYDSFIARGTTMVILGLGYLMYAIRFFDVNSDYPSFLVKLTPLIFLAILLIVHLVDHIALLHKAIESFADRTIIFIYLSVPISILSLLIFAVHYVI